MRAPSRLPALAGLLLLMVAACDTRDEAATSAATSAATAPHASASAAPPASPASSTSSASPEPPSAASAASVSAPGAVSTVGTAGVGSAADGKARRIFATRCASCHGPAGKGDGPIARSLTPPPRDYSDATWQAATGDAAIAAVIAKGGGAMKKSSTMPPSPDLAADPEALAAMVKLVRSFSSGT